MRLILVVFCRSRLVVRYMSECKKLASRILQGIAIGLLGEASQHYFSRRFMDDPTELFRVFCYPPHPHPPDADEWGVREHTDYGFLTLLKQDDAGGLEVARISLLLVLLFMGVCRCGR